MLMLHDFDLIQHNIPSSSVIYPIADVHLGAVEHAEEEWQAFLNKVQRDNAYLILAGDLLNNGVRSAGFANPFDEVLRPREAKRRMVEYLQPLKDRILCVVSGNHEQRTTRDSDQDLTYDICAKLDIEDRYRENIAFMSIGIGSRSNRDGAIAAFSFCVTHGSGGGIYTGASVNRNERFSSYIDGLDCFIAGHVHRGFVTKPSKIVIDGRNRKVSMKHYVVMSCVSWLNYGGYAARKMLLPSQICDPQKIKLIATNDYKKITTEW